MHDFVLAGIGGAMIGLAATLLMAGHGKIMGVSGIVSRLVPPFAADWGWRLSFAAGVVAAPLLYGAAMGTPPALEITGSLPLLIVGGLIVGAGTVTGSGCTSGHGVCGLPRLSARSFVATGIFMVTAVLTVTVIRHGIVVGG